MLPLSILILLFCFALLFKIGFTMAVVVLINSIKEKNTVLLTSSTVVILFYIAFGLFLLL